MYNQTLKTQSYNRKFSPSPQFLWTNAGNIPAASENAFTWEIYKPSSQKYLPFNTTRVVNNGESDIFIYPNHDENNAVFCPKGTIISIDERSLPAVTSFKIKNVGTNTITTGKIIITNSRSGQDADSIIQRLHKRLLGGIDV